MGRPSLAGHRKTFTYYSGQIGLVSEAAPPVLNKSWSVTADLQIPDNGVEGMIVTHGGIEGGYGLYVRDGKLSFVYNYLARTHYTFTDSTALPKGKVQVKVNFDYKGAPGEVGKAATVTVFVNGAKVASGDIAQTVPAQFTLGEGLDVGMDVGSPIDFTYKMPFKFTGGIDKVTYDLK